MATKKKRMKAVAEALPPPPAPPEPTPAEPAPESLAQGVSEGQDVPPPKPKVLPRQPGEAREVYERRRRRA